MNYFKQICIAIDQFINTLFGGWADETLSSRAYRRYTNAEDFFSKLPCRVIDTIFFWDYEERTWVTDWEGYEPGGTRTVRHCELSYESEKKRLQCAPEMRIENELN